MRVAVINTQVPFIHGGAEVHAGNLVDAIRANGHEAELIALPFKWYPAEVLLDHMTLCRMVDVTESNGVRIDKVIGLKFPAYLAPHPDKVLWILHQHRTAYDLWAHPEFGDLIHDPLGSLVRDSIINADKKWIPEAKRVYANSVNVAKRLKMFCGIDSEALYHPPAHAEKYYNRCFEKYLYFPSRINRLKRQSLVIEALALCKNNVRLIFSGAPDDPRYLNELKKRADQLGVAHRIEWLGYVTDQQKIDLYASCLGVVYTPLDEDYGYVTLEAMLSGKPVITTMDSGGPLEFVSPGRNGLVSEANAAELAECMDSLWGDLRKVESMGCEGRELYKEHNISWDHVVEELLR